MKTQRAITLLFVSILVFCAAVVIISWRSKQKQNQANITKDIIEKLHRAIANMESLEQLPPPTNGVTSSYHYEKDGKKNYEIADIQDTDQKRGIVLITTKDSKISIIFKPSPDNLEKFHVGWLTPVTFQCVKVNEGKCDFNSPYKLFVGNGLVEVKQLKFSKK